MHAFGKGEQLALSDLRLDYYDKDTPFDEAMKQLHNQAIVIVQGNNIIFERYREGMTEHDRHTWMSISKTSIPAVMGHLVDDGKVDFDQDMSAYLKSPLGCWSDSNIQHTADMNLILDHCEVYDDPNSDHILDEFACGYRVPVSNQEKGLAVLGSRKHFASVDTPAVVTEDNVCRYDSANTNALMFLCEDITGRFFQNIVSG